MGKRITIQQIAERAGVSRGTVDRVLNHRSYVSAEVRERVLAVIAETGYVSPKEEYRQKKEAARPPLKLGVLLPNWGDQFRQEVQAGIGRACQELEEQNVQVMIRRCETEIPGEAVDLLDELIREGAAGLAVCALNDPGIEKRINRLAEQKIPCVTFNSDLPGSRRLCFVGKEMNKAGRIAGELMSRCVPGKGMVLAAVGNRRFDGHRQRLEGFCDRMRERGFDSGQILTAETFNDYQTTYAAVAETLNKHPDLAGIYMANLNVSACAEAVRAAGRKGEIRVICHDINESIRRLLLEGSVDFTIPQDFEQQGYLPLILLRDYLRRGTGPEEGKRAGRIGIICAENL